MSAIAAFAPKTIAAARIIKLSLCTLTSRSLLR
jgi:hypothetical protein